MDEFTEMSSDESAPAALSQTPDQSPARASGLTPSETPAPAPSGFRFVGRERSWVPWLVVGTVVAAAIAVGVYFLVQGIEHGDAGAGRAGVLAGGTGLFKAEAEGQWGYIDKTGTMVIPARFIHAAAFSEGLAYVQTGSPDPHQCFIDTRGNVVFELPAGLGAGPGMTFSEGLLPVSQGGKWGFIDTRGKLVIPPTTFATAPGPFSDGRSLVGLKDAKGKILYGFIDRTGEWAIEPEFARAFSFSEGLALVTLATDSQFEFPNSGFIDTRGKWAIKPGPMGYESFREGLANAGAIQEDNSIKSGYVDKHGHWSIELRAPADGESSETGGTYVFAPHPFSDGLAEVDIMSDGEPKQGYVDKKGRWVIAPQSAWRGAFFSEGLAAVQDPKTRKWGYIDKSGSYVIQPQYFSASPFEEGVAQVTVSDWPPDLSAPNQSSPVGLSSSVDFMYIDRIGNVIFQWRTPVGG